MVDAVVVAVDVAAAVPVVASGWLASCTLWPPANSRPVVSESESDVCAPTQSVPMPDSTAV